MEQRLTLLDKITDSQYAESSPLLLEACALYLDNADKQYIAQLKWKNIGNQTINAILIDLVCFDAFGHEVKTQSYQYDRLAVAKGQFCGGKTAVSLGREKINRFEVVLKAVSFENGAIQEYAAQAAYKPLPADQPQELTGDLLAQYKRDLVKQGIKTDVLVHPQKASGLWQCVCKSWQMDGDACCACGADLEKLAASASPALLEEHLAAYREELEEKRKDDVYNTAKRKMGLYDDVAYQDAIALLESIPGWRDADQLVHECQSKLREIEERAEAERLARERAAEEARIKAEAEAKKRKQRNIILAVLAVVAVAVFLLVTKVIIPNQKYDTAMALKNEAKYSEAIAAFAALEGYRDSEEQITACETAILDGKYDAAAVLMNAGKYSEAIAAFAALEGYRDSEEQIAACETAILDGKYDAAVALMNDGKYLEAYESFVSMNGYKDSATKATVAYQQYKMPELKKVSVGSYITFGSYEQDNNIANGEEGIEWLVLAKEKNRLLVISRYALDCKPYNKEFESLTWETCTLRKWLNNDFLNAAFSSTEKAMIPTVMVSADKNPYSSTSPGNATQDKVFLLSSPEVNKYFASNSARQCKPTAYAKGQGAWTYNSDFCWWWLRSPGDYQCTAANVSPGGDVYEGGHDVDDGMTAVRPALWIDLEP